MRKLAVEKLDDLDIVLRVTRLEFDKNGKLQIVIKKFEESLSDGQRGLYWRWVGVICADTGDTKQDFHDNYKTTVFLNIYLADPENHPVLCDAVNAMKTIKGKIPDATYNDIRKCILSETSHMCATVENMRDVLKQLESDANSLGIRLPPPPSQDYLNE